MKGVLFESYPDPLIDFINSNLTNALLQLYPELLGTISLPPIKNMGYFPLV